MVEIEDEDNFDTYNSYMKQIEDKILNSPSYLSPLMKLL
jgi:hypothetical protein